MKRPRLSDFDRVLGPLIQDLEGLEAVAGPLETGDSYPLAPLRSCRTHLSLEKDAPDSRPVEPLAMGKVIAIPNQRSGASPGPAIWSGSSLETA